MIQTVATNSIDCGATLAEQLSREDEQIKDGIARYEAHRRRAEEHGHAARLRPAEELLVQWLDPLTAAIAKEQEAIRRGRNAIGRRVYGPHLKRVPAAVAAVVTMYQTIGHCCASVDGTQVVTIAHDVGRGVMAELQYREMKERDRPIVVKLKRKGQTRLARPDLIDMVKARKGYLSPYVVNEHAKKVLEDPVTSRRTFIHLGCILMYLMLHNTAADGRPALELFTMVDGSNGIRLSDAALVHLARGHEQRRVLRPAYYPMVVPPRPRDASGKGGYYKTKTPFTRHMTPTTRARLSAADLRAAAATLSDLEQQSWRVHDLVVQAQRRCFDLGGGLLGIPRRDDLEVPEYDFDSKTKAQAREQGDVIAANDRAKRDRLKLLNEWDTYEDCGDQVWFPHCFDFRFRAYALPNYVNHYRSDRVRGCLTFGTARRLNRIGWYWLRYHCASMFGVRGERDRLVDWTERHMSRLAQLATRPEAHYDWLSEASDPWQFLAAAIEVTAAAHGGKPHRWESNLPVQLDGTCSAMQHMACALRSESLAELVNLLGYSPVDLYEEVTALARADVAASDHPLRDQAMPWLQRKYVKGPVVALTFGVTPYGARQRLQSQMIEATGSKVGTWNLSKYVVEAIMPHAEDVCRPAVEAMKWMQDCARVIARKGDLVEWTHPLGMPVIQPYRRYDRPGIKTILAEVYARVHDESKPPDIRKQASAVAANVMQSIDSAHMMMTASPMRAAHHDIACVHDCFWTHASSADVLSHTLRHTMMRLHETPQLHRIHAEWAAKYDVPDPPRLGSFDIKEIRHATHAFQ
jgi:DNA-directed RNA polymerase